MFAGIRKFERQVFPERQGLFEDLAAGQKPELLLITCSDSRIDTGLLTQTEPGEVFVLRNAGNLVPPAGSPPGAEAATIEFAIHGLGIRHIAVCGHTHCGAMKAVRDPSGAEKLPALRAWLEHARPALDREASVEGADDPALRLVAANVLVQIDHLRTHPAVADAESRGDLTLHGWVYRFEAGEVLQVLGGSVRPLNEPVPAAAAATR